jgi:hypothetical protein
MNRWLCPLAVLASVWCSGCGTFWEIAFTNLHHDTVKHESDLVRTDRLYKAAGEALGPFAAANPDHPISPDFACGFKDGFVDFVERGGNGEAPPNPPWYYQLARYDSLQGRQGQQDYNAGFRAGSATGRASGLRELVLIPPGQLPARATDPDQQRIVNPEPAPPANAILPAPRMEPAENVPAPIPVPEKMP